MPLLRAVAVGLWLALACLLAPPGAAAELPAPRSAGEADASSPAGSAEGPAGSAASAAPLASGGPPHRRPSSSPSGPTGAGADAPVAGDSAEPQSASVARRVVSMNPSLTAIFVALDATSSLLGVDEYSARQQEAVADLPRVGGLFSPDLEAVVALQPDLVVLVPSMEQRSFRQRLEELGIPVLALANLSFDSVLRSIAEIGRRVGREAAARERIEAIRRTRAEIEQATEGRPRPRALLVLQREPIFVVGPGSFLDEMLRAAGAENAAAELDSPYPRVSAEWVVASAPEVILDSSGDERAAETYWSRWPSLPAVRDDRVVSVPQRIVTLPGPYLDRALARLARMLHGPKVLARVGAAR